MARNTLLVQSPCRTWTKPFRTGADATFWETIYGDDSRGNAVRFDFYVIMDF